MKEIDIVSICKKVLQRLSALDYEKIDVNRIVNITKNPILNKQLIFPVKNGGDDRISEQELRQLFIDEFKDLRKDLYYSIETPTKTRYKFGEKFNDISVSEEGRSASLDMCIYKKVENHFKRELNVEFKYDNVSLYKIGKDILKLMHEDQNGAFILLLKNTDGGTLCNKGKTGVLDKLYKSFEKFGSHLKVGKSIELVIISLENNTLIQRKVYHEDLNNLKKVFSINSNGFGDIKTVNEDSSWTKYELN
ncbi:MAG: hypothetical protein KDC90_16425 [Ignavibacteriae bacterium]|nr:hypothetical protein [Ignavibacteriota bacterium]